MTRYEFEVLSHLERNGAGQYSLRTLSDTLTISGGEISRCLEQLAAKHWITQDGDTLAVTDAGLAALEPYRVKRAIILAAGFGSRMMPATADRLGFGTSPLCGATGRNALTRCWKSTPS